eukprot:m.229547 g.229547  ORF g.229547 m.229547 type:complete len:825 (-) comp10862_c0_seq3:218-2692(-)
MQHPLIDKATIVAELRRLSASCRGSGDDVPGVSPQAMVALELLACDALLHGLRPGPRSAHQTVLEFAQLEDQKCPATLETPAEKAKLHGWICRKRRKKRLMSALAGLRQDRARIDEYYEAWAIIAIDADFALVCGLLEEILALPWKSLYDSLEPCESVLLAKNHVEVAYLRGPDKYKPASGYFCVAADQPALSPTTLVRLVWTPNSHFTRRQEASRPLPPNWDEGYDPVTGDRYYINHRERRTTWSDPRDKLAAPAASTGPTLLAATAGGDNEGEDDYEVPPSPVSPMKSTSKSGRRERARREAKPHSFRCTCNFDGPESPSDSLTQPCSIVVNISSAEPVSMSLFPLLESELDESSPTEDCGVLRIQPDAFHSGLSRLAAPLEFKLARGGFGTLAALMDGSPNCSPGMSLANSFGEREGSVPRSAVEFFSLPSQQHASSPNLSANRTRTRQSTISEYLYAKPLGRESWTEEMSPSGALQAASWSSFVDADGRIEDWAALTKLIFFRGIDSTLRPMVWKFLCGVYPRDSTAAERRVLDGQLLQQYEEQKLAWMRTSIEDGEALRSLVRNVGKDVARTDRDYELFKGSQNLNLRRLLDILVTSATADPELGYAQGMSDLLSPFLAIGCTEVESYWCFRKLMGRMGSHFDELGMSMHQKLDRLRLMVQLLMPQFYDFLCTHDLVNMFFAYRWLLLDFKREFALPDVVRIWETIWTQHRSDHFSYFIAVAIIDSYSHELLQRPMQTDEVMEFYNRLSNRMDVEQILQRSRALLYEFRHLPDVPADLLFLTHSTERRASADAQRQHAEAVAALVAQDLVARVLSSAAR